MVRLFASLFIISTALAFISLTTDNVKASNVFIVGEIAFGAAMILAMIWSFPS